MVASRPPARPVARDRAGHWIGKKFFSKFARHAGIQLLLYRRNLAVPSINYPHKTSPPFDRSWAQDIETSKMRRRRPLHIAAVRIHTRAPKLVFTSLRAYWLELASACLHSLRVEVANSLRARLRFAVARWQTTCSCAAASDKRHSTFP